MACVVPDSLEPAKRQIQPAYKRIDTLQIKKQLHDLLGENGLPYWQTLTSFLSGKLSRQELDELVGGISGVDGQRLIPLHNHFLISLISNASNAPSSQPPPSSLPLSSKRARRPDDPTPYGAKKRVLGWVLGMPKRERERVKVYGAGAGEDSDEEEGESGREERRRGGAGWVGGSEMERERVVLGEVNGVNAQGSATSLPPTPTHASHPSRPRTTALESRSIPSTDQLKDRIARVAAESGLDGASPAVGRVMALAVETHMKTLITTHLHLHRSNLQSSPSIHPAGPKASTSTTAVPSLDLSSPPSPSAASSVSSGGPHTPPNTFSLHALEGVLASAPGQALEVGHVARSVGGRLLGERDWEEIWTEAAAEEKKWGSGPKIVKKEIVEEKEKEVSAGEAAGGKKKKKDHAYDYVDPRSILDSVLG